MSWCPRCGGGLFQVIPGRTEARDICAFQDDAVAFEGLGPTEYDRGWLHPGLYCEVCDFVLLTTEECPGKTADFRPFVLTVINLGPDRVHVAALLGGELLLPPGAVLELLNSPSGIRVARDAERLGQLEALQSRLVALGAVAVIDRG